MTCPSLLHIAAAKAINDAKPAHLSIREYIQSLRQFSVTRHENGQTHREIDHSAFWQAQHAFNQSDLEKARNDVFVLGQRNEALEAQVLDLQTQLASGVRKRKMTVQKDKTVVKKLKTVEDDVALSELASEPGYVTTAMRNIQRVESLCRGQMYGTEASDLSYHLIEATEALRKIIDSLSGACLKQNDNATSTIISLARSCTCIFHGLKRLAGMAGSGNYPSHVVFACVGMFDSLFTSIEEAASAKTSSHEIVESDNIISSLTALATSLITALQASAPTCVSHAELLEGLTYHLLHRVGELAHEILLEGPRNSNIEAEIKNLPLSEEKRLDPHRIASLQSMNSEAPYLLNILKRAVSNTASLSGPLAQSARLRLQRTLVDCIFGAGSRGSGASADVLKLPEIVGAAPVPKAAVAVSGDADKARDWFEAELWAVIGWDVLGRDEDL